MQINRKKVGRGFLSTEHVLNNPVRSSLPESCTICKGDCKDTYEKMLGDTAMIICGKTMEVLKHVKVSKQSAKALKEKQASNEQKEPLKIKISKK